MILDQLLRLRDGGTTPLVTATEAGVTTLTRLTTTTGQVVVAINKTPLRGLAIVLAHGTGVEHSSGSKGVLTIEASDAKSYTTVQGVTNAELKFTSRDRENPDISIKYTEGTPVTIVVTGNDIEVKIEALATKASEIKAAIEADAAANALVSVSYPGTNTGVGLPGLMTAIKQFYDEDDGGLDTPVTFPAVGAGSADAAIAANLVVRRIHTQKKFVRSVITVDNDYATGVDFDIFVGDMIPEED
ncbi:hypothetical protein ES707_01296 [subsurface metagenome]